MLYPDEIRPSAYRGMFVFSVISATDHSTLYASFTRKQVVKRGLQEDMDYSASLKFDIEVKEHSASKIVIKLDFQDPDFVSTSRDGADMLQVKVLNINQFRSS